MVCVHIVSQMNFTRYSEIDLHKRINKPPERICIPAAAKHVAKGRLVDVPFYSLAENCTISQCNRVAIVIDGAGVADGCHRAVARQSPGAALTNCHNCIVVDSRSSVSVIDDINRSGECAAVLQCHVQRRDAVDRDIALERLAVAPSTRSAFSSSPVDE